ncbi:MAG: molecular chaperone DnaJ [Desulfobacteraceae bacterium 4572_130]|nr:MAG: molecular chaperone DnaJ [Desulfobacteraceae bacterium 4572_130]
MSEKRDYYEVLGVQKNASKDELKTKYRKLAIRFHPDKNPDNKEAEEKFKEASEAYQILSNDEKRQVYDQFGHQGLDNSGFSSSGSFDDIFSSFGDIFGDFFGFGDSSSRSSKHQRGADLRYDMSLDFMEAAFGVEKEIEVQKLETCNKCKGTGCRQGTSVEICKHCQGTGQFVQTQGFFRVKTTCPYCRGKGSSIPHPCNKCIGSGRIKIFKKVSVKIPPGVDNGSRLRLTGEGETNSQGNFSGDLYVFINVEPHKKFKRDGINILCLIEISFIQAALGDNIEISTLNGKKTLKIPKGTQYGDTFKFQGQGIPSLRNKKRGDQIIQVTIKTPRKLSKKQIKLLKEFNKLDSNKISNRLKNLFKNI